MDLKKLDLKYTKVKYKLWNQIICIKIYDIISTTLKSDREDWWDQKIQKIYKGIIRFIESVNIDI